MRKQELVNREYYHIFSRSIAKYVVFNDSSDFDRMIKLMNLYRFDNFQYKYSHFIELEATTQALILNDLRNENDLLVEIVAYCIMPTHIHMILRQVKNNGISKYAGRVLNAYSRYFNEKHHRNGPLWTGRFKNVLVEKDEQLLHLTRYIHLNPVSSGLINKPEDWEHSSYAEFIGEKSNKGICNYESVIDIEPKLYKKFVNDGKDYQRSQAIIKSTLIDDYTG